MTVPGSIEAGQVWEHRAFCRLCKTPQPHRHRYLILSADAEAGHAMVRDLSVKGSRLEPFSRYALSLDVFGSFEKGGLRHCGHWVRSRFEALPDTELDDRLVEHPRIQLRSVPQWRGKLPVEDLAA